MSQRVLIVGASIGRATLLEVLGRAMADEGMRVQVLERKEQDQPACWRSPYGRMGKGEKRRRKKERGW